MRLIFTLNKLLHYIVQKSFWVYIALCLILEKTFWEYGLLFRLLLMIVPSIIYVFFKKKCKNFVLLSTILLFIGTFGYVTLNAYLSSTSTEINIILLGIGSLFWGLSLFFEKAKQQK